MPFYKKQDQELQCAPNFVYAPNYTLKAEEKDNHTYPVDGWYWFDTLELAMAGMAPATQTVSRRQFKLALLQLDLLDAVEAFVNASTDNVVKISYNEAVDFDPANPLLLAMVLAMGKTQEDLDAVFALARTL